MGTSDVNADVGSLDGNGNVGTSDGNGAVLESAVDSNSGSPSLGSEVNAQVSIGIILDRKLQF